MSYSTNSQVIERIGVTKLEQLHGGQVKHAIIKGSRRAAAGEMNAYLSVQEPVPVDTFDQPDLEIKLRDVELSLVEYLEHTRNDITETPQRVKDRREEAIEWLQRVHDRRITLRPGHGHRVASFEARRGDTRCQVLRRPLAFDWESLATSQATEIEFDDTGQPYWVADRDGFLDMLNVRSGPGETVPATVKPTINGTAISSDVLTASIWSSAADLRALKQTDALVPIAQGDKIGVVVTPASALSGGVELKVMLRVLAYEHDPYFPNWHDRYWPLH